MEQSLENASSQPWQTDDTITILFGVTNSNPTLLFLVHENLLSEVWEDGWTGKDLGAQPWEPECDLRETQANTGVKAPAADLRAVWVERRGCLKPAR